ncbi:TrbC/VirB2 family protein [Wolbachia endosymbiont (group E) of Neria commutata]|uniref:TrbC/VirB2 family protein n=1 Tax=Wolbachia endosymbiont (group E) of Neria commutata TaxID=3066149 RepID=UPI0031330175
MNLIIKKKFSIFLIILLFSFSHSSGANTQNKVDDIKSGDATTQVICNIIGYVWGIGGPLMTVVIIGAAMMAIFGRMPWPALFALGVFCAVFFGAKAIVTKVMGGIGTSGDDYFTKQCGVKDDPKNPGGT